MNHPIERSVSEIRDIVKRAEEQSVLLKIPGTAAGIDYRAKKEEWLFREVPTQGGKSGVKRVYTLPSYIIDELRDNGLLYLLEQSGLPENTESEPETEKQRSTHPVRPTADGVPDLMRPLVNNYDTWAERQDKGSIVPVRYHVNVFGAAGNGYELFDDVETEAMWFRASFFDYLGVSPDKCFCTRVKGDSMHPTLIDRGTVLWQMANRYTSEGIYLFRQVNELRIKRLQMVNRHTIQIVSDSSDKDIYPTTLLDLSDLQDHEFEIYGRYLWDCGISR